MDGKYAFDQCNLQAYFLCDLFVDFVLSAHELVDSVALFQLGFGTRVGYVICVQSR